MPDPVEPTTPEPAKPGTPVILTPAANQPGTPSPQEMFPRSYVEELRGENAKYRTERNELAKERDGLNKEVERLKPLEGQIKSMKVDAAFGEVASKAGVDPKLARALLRDEIGALDPSSDKFAESLASLVEKAAKDTPAIKVVQPSGTSGAPKAGSDITHPNTTTPLANDQWSREQLAAARKAGDHEGIAKALKEGKLKGILGA